MTSTEARILYLLTNANSASQAKSAQETYNRLKVQEQIANYCGAKGATAEIERRK